MKRTWVNPAPDCCAGTACIYICSGSRYFEQTVDKTAQLIIPANPFCYRRPLHWMLSQRVCRCESSCKKKKFWASLFLVCQKDLCVQHKTDIWCLLLPQFWQKITSTLMMYFSHFLGINILIYFMHSCPFQNVTFHLDKLIRNVVPNVGFFLTFIYSGKALWDVPWSHSHSYTRSNLEAAEYNHSLICRPLHSFTEAGLRSTALLKGRTQMC